MSGKGLTQGSGDPKKPAASRADSIEEELLNRGGKTQPAKTAAKAAPPAAPAQEAPAGPAIMATHTVQSGDTLSHLALKYYKQATREKWMIIYEANKELLGKYPGLMLPGQELIIPQLEE